MVGPLIALGVAFFLAPPPSALTHGDLPPLVIREATWGARCGAPAGNATAWARRACGDDRVCRLAVDAEQLGDPAPGCDKALEVVLACGPGEAETRRARGASGAHLVLSCGDVIDVTRASYGDNCGAPAGNATAHLEAACEGRDRCGYVVDFELLGDPAPGCPKRYAARWRCTGGGEHDVVIPPEAGAKRAIELRCPARRGGDRLTVR